MGGEKRTEDGRFLKWWWGLHAFMCVEGQLEWMTNLFLIAIIGTVVPTSLLLSISPSVARVLEVVRVCEECVSALRTTPMKATVSPYLFCTNEK